MTNHDYNRGPRNSSRFDYSLFDDVPNDTRSIDAEVMAALCESLGEFAYWLVEPEPASPTKKPMSAKTIGLRAIAALWVLKPEAIDRSTLPVLAKKLKVSPAILSRYALRFTAKFGISSRCQFTDDTRGRMSAGHRGKKKALPRPPADLSRN